jgi:MerR family mercuric resistance operon transcriptional regulator
MRRRLEGLTLPVSCADFATCSGYRSKTLDRAGFTIGRLSAETSVNVETIRYYERIRLMAKPARSKGGRRLYDQTDLRRLAFIRRARQLGFSINDIRTLVTLSSGKGHCADVRALTIGHLDQVRAKIADLRKLERTLAKAADRCLSDKTTECPIIDTLSMSSQRRAGTRVRALARTGS